MSLGPERRRVTANSGFWSGPSALQSYAGVLKTSAKDDPNMDRVRQRLASLRNASDRLALFPFPPPMEVPH